MNKLRLPLLALIVFCAPAACPHTRAANKVVAAKSSREAPIAELTVDLRDQLEKGLKARRPEEFEFIDQVVKHVESGKLSLALVQKAFLWARKKKPFPFPYFVRALKELAAAENQVTS